MMIAALILLSTTSPAIAGNLVCKYPKECVQPLGSKYSTGGGNKVIQYVQLDCRDKQGGMVSYIDQITALSGLFGFGRLTMPDRITFKASTRKTMECK